MSTFETTVNTTAIEKFFNLGTFLKGKSAGAVAQCRRNAADLAEILEGLGYTANAALCAAYGKMEVGKGSGQLSYSTEMNAGFFPVHQIFVNLTGSLNSRQDIARWAARAACGIESYNTGRFSDRIVDKQDAERKHGARRSSGQEKKEIILELRGVALQEEDVSKLNAVLDARKHVLPVASCLDAMADFQKILDRAKNAVKSGETLPAVEPDPMKREARIGIK